MPDIIESTNPGGGNHQIKPLALSLPAKLSSDSEASPEALGKFTKSLPAVLAFAEVSKWYGPVIGVNEVSLELRPGITGLVGANGAGKTTLLRLAAGQLRPDLGRVLVAGHDAWTPKAKWQVGFCPELDVFYEEMTGRRFVQAMALLCGFHSSQAKQRTEEVLHLVGMTDRADRPLAGYSKGMRQRIKLAQALVHDPQLLLLDEPLSGIDPVGRRESIALFHQLAGMGKCLLISSHEIEELEKLTDHVAIMARGRIAAVGTLAQIRDLFDKHPRSIRIASDQNPKLSLLLMEMEEVVGIEKCPDGDLIIRAHNPRRFFAKVHHLVLDENIQIHHLEILDESTQSILGYLLGKNSN